MPADIGSLKVFMGPSDLGAPDDLEAAVIDFIDGARDTLDVAVQELESKPITEAIVAAAQGGVSVRVVLERDYLTLRNALADPFQAGGQNEANREMHNALLRSKVGVITDLNPNFFHQKFMVRDWATSSRAAVMTGSANFTPTGMHKNLNHLVHIGGKRTAEVYSLEFEELWTGTFGVLRERHDPHPKEYSVSSVRTKVLFAPDHQPEMEIMKQMLKASKRVDFAVYTFADSSGIDDTMLALHKGGMPVRGVVCRTQASQKWSAHGPLADAGIDIRETKAGGGLGKLHHKLMVLDGEVIIAGSFNYTGPATWLNDENIIVIGDLEEKDATSRAQQKVVGAYALGEIDRIVSDHT